MVVGVCQIVLELPGIDSLKGKRSLVRSLIDRTQQRFRIAVAEVDLMDVHQRAIIGISLVSNDKQQVETLLMQVENHIEQSGVGRLIKCDKEIVHWESDDIRQYL